MTFTTGLAIGLIIGGSAGVLLAGILNAQPTSEDDTVSTTEQLGGATVDVQQREPVRHSEIIPASRQSEQETEEEPADSATEMYEVTAYTAECDGCIGITKTGVDVRDTMYHNGKRIVAVDPNVIPLGSTVKIKLKDGSKIEATAQDIGGAIKGRRIALLVSDEKVAKLFGRQELQAEVVQ